MGIIAPHALVLTGRFIILRRCLAIEIPAFGAMVNAKSLESLWTYAFQGLTEALPGSPGLKAEPLGGPG